MKNRLELELDFVTDIAGLELAAKVAPLIQEAVEAVKQRLGCELEVDIFLVQEGDAVRVVLEPV